MSKTMAFAHLHWVRYMLSSTFEPGLKAAGERLDHQYSFI